MDFFFLIFLHQLFNCSIKNQHVIWATFVDFSTEGIKDDTAANYPSSSLSLRSSGFSGLGVDGVDPDLLPNLSEPYSLRSKKTSTPSSASSSDCRLCPCTTGRLAARVLALLGRNLLRCSSLGASASSSRSGSVTDLGMASLWAVIMMYR